ncbi:MAG TPA: hypothetical protein DCY20_01295, partial [Firmicutes bacterium]|nr:hypothetical protein [Bacillota bacterium]
FIFLGTLSNQFFIIILSFMAAFCFQFIFNTIANSTVMLVTPVHMRGKVMATISTLAMSISPIGNLVG